MQLLADGTFRVNQMTTHRFPFAQAAWAASAASTLETLLTKSQATVGLIMGAAGGRGQSQSNAAEGKIGGRTISRIIEVSGNPQTTPLEIIASALQLDSLTAAYRGAGLILNEEMSIEIL